MLASLRVCLLVEAVTGGFYVSATRNFFVPMLVTFDYDIDLISRLYVVQSLVAVALLALLYRLGDRICRNVKTKLVVLHGIERVLWALLPVVVSEPSLEIALSTVAMTVSAPVGLYVNYLMYVHFDRESLVKFLSRRFALSALSSVLGCICGIALVYSLDPKRAYTLLYLLAAAVGLIGTACILLTPLREVEVRQHEESTSVEVEIRKVNAFLFFVLYCAYLNIVLISWIPLTKDMLGLSDFEITLFAIVYSLGVVVGSTILRSMASCRLAVVAMVCTFPVLPLLVSVLLNYVAYFVFSLCSVGGFLIVSALYSSYARQIGHVKVSLLTQLGYQAGLAVAAVSLLLGLKYIYLLAALIGSASLLILFTAIPELAIVPERVALDFARTVYTISITSATYAMLITREAISLFLRALGLTLLMLIIYMLYNMLNILTSV